MIVDPHVAVAGLLVYYLKAAIPSLESNGHFGSARAVLEELPKLKPRLVIIELSLGDGLGLSVLRQLRAKLSNTAWLLFTGNPRIGIQDAIKLGVQGCVSKSASLP